MINYFIIFLSMMGNISDNIIPSKINSVNDIYKCTKYYELEAVGKKEKTNVIDSSIVYIAYTKKEMVFLVKNWQKGINASSKRRDSEGLLNNSEDAVYILLGANGKGNDSYWIGVNPLGAILDKVISSSGMSEWDGDIKANCKERKDGWDALIEIPFNSISYSKCIWGIQIFRIEMNTLLVQYLFPNKSNNFLQTEGGMSIDFDYITKGSKFDISLIPSVRVELKDKNLKYFAGGTMRYKNGTNDLLDITVFPDFSEVEADIQKFNLNRLPYNYPEKRPFFVEGSSLIKSPILLFRSRNVEDLQYGLKFYNISDKSSFITYFINDTTTGKSSISRFSYSPFQALKLGTYFQLNSLGYNLMSSDLSGYIKKINLDLQGQISSNIENSSNLYYFNLSREEKPGYSMSVSYTSIDSQFVNPFNNINIYFDGINELNGYLSYYYLKNGKYFVPSIRYNSVINKYDRKTIYNELGFSATAGYLPFLWMIQYDNSNLDYLGLPNCKTRTVTLGVIYLKSSWNQFTFIYTFGNYLGGILNQLTGDFKINLHKTMNIGLSAYKIKSSYDNLFISQLYGHISLYREYLFIKPYINYTMNNMTYEKKLSLNGILLLEPKYMSGIYIALSQEYGIDKGFILKSNKEIFKIQVGIKITK